MEVAPRHDRNNFKVKIGYFRFSRIIRSHHGVNQSLLQNLSCIVIKSLVLHQGFSIIFLLAPFLLRIMSIRASFYFVSLFEYIFKLDCGHLS